MDQQNQKRDKKNTNIRVVARFRPLNQAEQVNYIQQQSGQQAVCKFPNDKTVLIERDKDEEVYTFDQVFGIEAQQKEVFDVVGRPVIQDVLDGYNGTVFAYGQTGSGKTFTMFGADITDNQLRGIIPRAAQMIFKQVQLSDQNIEFALTCSMLEIYKENLRDLLAEQDGVELKIKQSQKNGIFVEGLTEVSVINDEELLEVIQLGENMRTVAATNMNAVSSRSHQLFVLDIKQKLPNGVEKQGRLNLVDLAGSEKIRKTGVTGNKLEEAKKINMSLSALGNVIKALIVKSEHVPYRDSKLTRLLQESLGGNYKTTLIVACSPSPRNLEETLSTLKFAQRARNIKNQITMNIKKSPEAYIRIINKLKARLKQLMQENKFLKEGLIPESMIETHHQRINRSWNLEPVSPRYSEPIEIQILPRSITQQDFQNESAINLSTNQSQYDEHIAEIENQASLIAELECQIKSQETQIQNLKDENLDLKNSLEQLQEKLKEQGIKELKIYKEQNEKLQQYDKLLLMINKDSSDNMILRRENEQLQRQCKSLSLKIVTMEQQYKKLSQTQEDMKSSTLLEFETRSDKYLNHMTSPEDSVRNSWIIEEGTQYINETQETVSLPIDIETLYQIQPYTQRIQQTLESNSTISKDISIFQLKNQLIQAGFINCNFASVLYSLQWRNELVQKRYQLKRDICRHQQDYLRKLEGLIDNSHKQFNHVYKLVEKVFSQEFLTASRHLSMENKSKVYSNVKRVNTRRYTKVVQTPLSLATPQNTQLLRSSQKKMTMQWSLNTPFAQNRFTEVGESQGYVEGDFTSSRGSPDLYSGEVSRKINYLDINLNLYKTYNEQLRTNLEDANSKIDGYKKILKALEKSVVRAYQQNRQNWSYFLKEFKDNCERELIRKHNESVQLSSVIGEWIHKYMEIYESVGISRLRQNGQMQEKFQHLYMDEMWNLIQRSKTSMELEGRSGRLDKFLKQNIPIDDYPDDLFSN